MKKITFNPIKLLQNSFIVSFGTIIGRLSLVISQILLARFLGPDQYGLFILGWTILRLNGIFSVFGIDKTVIFLCSGKSFDSTLNQNLSIAIILSTLISLLSCSLIYFNSIYISMFFSSINLNIYLPSFAIICFLYILNQILASITRVNNQMIFSLLIKDLIQPVVMIILILLLKYFDLLTLQNVLNILIITFFIPFSVGIFFIKKTFPKFLLISFSFGKLNEFVKHSFSAFTAGIFSMLMLWVDRIMIGIYCTNSDLGVYQVATQSTMIVTMFIASLSMAMSPSISKFYKDLNYNMIEEYFIATVRWSCYICFPMIVILYTNSQNFISLIYGSSFSYASDSLKILSIAKLVHVICGSVGILLVMTNNNKIWFKGTVCFFIINILFNFYLIPKFGIIGAAISTCISISLLFLFGRLIINKRLKISLYNHAIFKIFISFILTLFIINFLAPFFGAQTLSLMLFSLLTYAIFFILIFISKVYKIDFNFLYNENE
tara:strand:+ start:3156 stop:4631 length:1476 start_codon:yes stop_codon:yes gene_type:complete